MSSNLPHFGGGGLPSQNVVEAWVQLYVVLVDVVVQVLCAQDFSDPHELPGRRKRRRRDVEEHVTVLTSAHPLCIIGANIEGMVLLNRI